MRYARLGPRSVLVRVLITELGLPCRGFTPPFRVQGWATGFGSTSSSSSKQAGNSKVLATTPWVKTGNQVAQNDRGANAHHHKQVLLHFELSSPFYGQFSVQKWPFLGCFQDDRPENSRRSPVCQVGVCNEGRCSSMAIGLSKDGKWVFNTACTMPWCHTVVHFEMKMSCFSAVFRDDRPDRGSTSLKQAALLQR